MSLLVAAVLFLQDTTAEETFKKIREVIQSAKTLTVKSKVDNHYWNGGKEGRREQSALIMLKDGNKAYISDHAPESDKDMKFLLISDGSKMMGKYNDYPSKTAATPKDLNALLSANLCFRSVRILMWRMIYSTPKPDEPGEFQPVDFKYGDDDGKAKTIVYTDKGLKYESKLKLWYEPKSFKVLKQVETFKFADDVYGTSTETYEEFVINADIPDEKFKLPADK